VALFDWLNLYHSQKQACIQVDNTEKSLEPLVYTNLKILFFRTNYNGGTCWMKKGAVTKANAYFVNDPAIVCGLL
jgi:hypothetical protein